VANNIPRLLPGEGTVGQFGELNKIRRTGDNLTPHHIPSDAYMKQIGISGYTRNKGIAILMEQPYRRNFLRSTGLDLITNYRLPIPNSQFPIPNKYKTMFLDAGKHGL
jgi:hypothetical protein